MNKHALARLERLNDDFKRWNDLANSVIQISRCIQFETMRRVSWMIVCFILMLYLSIDAESWLTMIVIGIMAFCTIHYYARFHIDMMSLRFERAEFLEDLLSMDSTLRIQAGIISDEMSLLADTEQFKEWEKQRIIHRSFRSILTDCGFVKKD